MQEMLEVTIIRNNGLGIKEKRVFWEEINNIEGEREAGEEIPVIEKKRRREINWVRNKLSERLHAAFLDKLERQDEQKCFEDILLKELPLSNVAKRAVSRMLKDNNREGALNFVWDYQLKKELADLGGKAEIPPTTWNAFRNAGRYTSAKTFDKIIVALELTPEEKREFLSQKIEEIFPVTEVLQKEVYGKIEEKFGTDSDAVDVFLDESYISESAWKHYRKKECGDDDNEQITSQKILLKMILCFQLDEEQGRTFLNLVDSDFIMERDVVVLACMHLEVYHAKAVYFVLDAFSGKEKAKTRLKYQNLYKWTDFK